MRLCERQINGVTIIDVSGDLAVPPENPRALSERVTAVLLRGDRRILLNFENLKHVDSTCVGEVVDSYKTTISNGGILKLAHLSPHLRNLLHTTALDTILESYETEGEAIATFAETPLPEPARTVLTTASILFSAKTPTTG